MTIKGWQIAMLMGGLMGGLIGTGLFGVGFAAADTISERLSLRVSMKAPSDPQDQKLRTKGFTVAVDGRQDPAVFAFEGGLSICDIVEYKDGDDGTQRTRPGNCKPGKITITKDWSNTSEWYAWRKTVLDGKVDRRSVSVIFHNDAGEEAGRMLLLDAYPTDYQGPSDNAKSSGHATEKMDISWKSAELKVD